MPLYRSTLMTVKRALQRKRSPWNRLSWPTARSNRLRGAMRGGLWSSFSVPGAGIFMYLELYCEPGQRFDPEPN